MNWPTLQACARRSSIFDPKHCPCKSVCSFDEFHASSRRVLLWVFRSWWCFLASQGSLRAGHGVAAIRSWDVSNPRSSIAPRRQSFAERCFTRSQLAIPTNCRCSVRKNEDDKGKPVFFNQKHWGFEQQTWWQNWQNQKKNKVTPPVTALLFFHLFSRRFFCVA